MKNLFLKGFTLIAIVVMVLVVFSKEMALAKPRQKKINYERQAEIDANKYGKEDPRSPYQNYWRGNRDNNPTTRNEALMLEYAQSWAEFAVDNVSEWMPGIYNVNTNLGKAKAIAQWLQWNCEIDGKMAQVKKAGAEYLAVEDMDFLKMRKYLGKFDPYSIFARASKKWDENKKAKVNTLQFVILYQLLCDTLNYEISQVPDPEILVEVYVGKKDFGTRPSVEYYDRKGNKKTYYPPKERLDFRVVVRTTEGNYYTVNLVDMESILKGKTGVEYAFNMYDTNIRTWDKWGALYEMKRFYRIVE